MTLDRRILLMLSQPRVISVLSYYLTSLINLSFCRFFRRCLSSPVSLPLHVFIYIFYFHDLVSEKPLCRNSSGVLASSVRLTGGCIFRFAAAFKIDLCKCFLLTSDASSLDLIRPFTNFYLPLTTSILLRAPLCELSGFYLYIGITLSGYNIAQGSLICNMENCIK